ncbi:hypothetical protein [Shewanella algae]|uniref:hypothetical protein n=1 Tax=Shewanella algae TaxID=38313 RepID=UPI0031F5A229
MKNINPLYLVPVALLIVLGPFVFTFWGTSFSTSMQDWAHFGTYFAGMLTPVAGLAIFWQMREKQKQDQNTHEKETLQLEQQGFIKTYELAAERINTLIDFYDPFFVNAYKITFRAIMNGVVNPHHEFYIPSADPYSTPAKGTLDYAVQMISAYLVDMRTTAIKIKDVNYLFRFNMQYSLLAAELTRHGWIEKKHGDKMAADSNNPAQPQTTTHNASG